MKRAIKYYNIYQSDKANFSDCSTKYEILPGLYPDTAGTKELKELAKSLGFKNPKLKKLSNCRYLSHSFEVGTKEVTRHGDTETVIEYIGFFKLPEVKLLPPKEKINSKPPKDIFMELANVGGDAVGLRDYAEIDGDMTVIKSGWKYFHIIPMLGYSLAACEKQIGATEGTFEDEVDQCSMCGAYDYRDDGYNYNFRVIDCENLGINCGCYQEAAVNNYEYYVNSHDECIDAGTAAVLSKKKKIKKVETFIGGMVDGRGGYFNGQPTREGKPKEILADMLKANPKGKYIFAHEESGQFQTYFTLYEVISTKKPKKKG